MPVYQYRTHDDRGRKAVGRIAADSPRNARDELRAKGIPFDELREIQQRSANASRSATEAFPKKTSMSSTIQVMRGSWNQRRFGNQVTWFIRELSTLLRVGTSMVEAIDLSIAQTSKQFQGILMELRERVRSGVSLCDAMSMQAPIFDPLLIEMARVGESSGSLPSVLAQAAEFRERRSKLRNRVTSAMLYPAFVLFLSVAVTLFLMTSVVPSLIDSLQEMQQELPTPTVILKSASDILVRNGHYLLLLFLLCGGSMLFALSTVWGRGLRDRWVLSVPLFGRLVILQNCSRLCLVTATLLKSGVELVRSLEIAEQSIQNSVLKSIVFNARSRIQMGEDIGGAIAGNEWIPKGLVQVFTLGQNSGELDQLLLQIAVDYDGQVNTMTDRLTTVLEPLLIVGLSLIVGFILLATLLPILETGNALSGT